MSAKNSIPGSERRQARLPEINARAGNNLRSDSTGPFANLSRVNTVGFGPARSLDELKQAYALVYRNYLGREYIEPNEAGLRFGLHNLLPTTRTFVAVVGKTVVATVTLVEDGPLGLPMDQVYYEELSVLRRQGRRLGEVSMLADRRRRFARTLPVVMTLFRLMLDHAMQEGLTDLCIAINPRHEGFYRKVLHFDTLGEQKSYHSVRGAPALAKRLPLELVRELRQGDERFALWYRQAGQADRRAFDDALRLTPSLVKELLLLLNKPVPQQFRSHLVQLYGSECLPESV